MSKGTKADTKPSHDEAVKDAVEKTPGGTAEGIAGGAGIARSTAGKVLARLADAGEVIRHTGGRDGGKRLPNRWTLKDVALPAAFAAQVDSGEPAAAKPVVPSTAKAGAGKRRSNGSAGAGGDAAADPAGKPERLKAGGLEPLVLAYLKDNAESGPHGPTTVAKALGRSSGAVGNCLVRLAEGKQAKEVSSKPRRYSIAA